MLADNELLRRYTAERSESAFAELVERHADLVYAAALHQLHGHPDLARDVTQVVFTDLALKAASLPTRTSLAGWLYTSARFAAAKIIRSETRRQDREEKAVAMDNPDSTPGLTVEDPAQLRPLIEEAMQELDEQGREAVLLRYFEGHDYRAVGTALGISDDTARKRVARAVERLRAILQKRGVTSSEAALTTALGGAALLTLPANLHASVVRSALAVALGSTARIPSGVFQVTAVKTALLMTGLVAGLGTSALLLHNVNVRLRTDNESLTRRLAEAESAQDQWRAGQTALEEELARLRREHSELLKLRDEVTRLRSVRRQETKPEPVPREADDALLAQQQVTIAAKFAQMPVSVLRKASWEAIGIDISGGGMTAILTEAQSKALVRVLEQQAGVDILATPVITTLHNRQANVHVAAMGDPDAADAKLGPSLDVLPIVSADRLGVRLTTIAQLAELTSAQDDTGTDQKQVRQTSVAANGVVEDGQTVVLCQWVGRLEAGSAAPVGDPACLLVLVTPTLVDAAGNRLRSAEEITQETATTHAPVEPTPMPP